MDARYDEQRRAWLQAVGEFDAVLDAQCRTLTENAGGAIRASVRRLTDSSGFVERLRDALGTAAEFHKLAEVPPEIEWFANITNPSTRRAYQNAIQDFMRFTGINRPEEFRTVTRAHVIAWRDDLAGRELGGSTVRHRLAALSSLFEYLCGSNVRRDKLEALGEAITTAKDPGQRWSEIISDLEKLAEFDLERDGADRRPETPVLSAAGLTPSDLNRIGARLSSDDWLSLSLVVIRSKPPFEYRSREGDYIEFENASPGQQATALLNSLLSQSGPPLIIDQPEEDLDNPVMPEIVEQLWRAKANRQMIFASHNANVVVNGDAELVAWCDYRKAGDHSFGKIAGEGAIDVPHVRDAIKRVMEGGEAAFRLRKEKYGF